mmetsp:Transcript_85989/g.238183  ORF Transcript_85989/g.238183 Transcript_85989/m.238183 type:complete len:148 (+) Transcript_85989:90-533(+)
MVCIGSTALAIEGRAVFVSLAPPGAASHSELPPRSALKPARRADELSSGGKLKTARVDRHVRWTDGKVHTVRSYKDASRLLDWPLSTQTCDDCDERLPRSLVVTVSKRPSVPRCILCHCNILAEAAGLPSSRHWRLRACAGEVHFTA